MSEGHGGWLNTQEGIVVCKTMTTETAHRLMDYEGKCASIHGHSYKWEVMAALETRDTLPNGISIDFADLKKAMRGCIYDVYDHALVLCKEDPVYMELYSVFVEDGEMEFGLVGLPQKVVAFPSNPTAENFAKSVSEALQKRLNTMGDPTDPAVDIIRVRVWETANSFGQFIPAEASNF